MRGEDQRTTIMIKNIPCKFDQKIILDEISKKNKGNFDYFYLPIDLRTGCNSGYAFINFTHPFFILEFYLEFQDFEWSLLFQESSSEKVCKLAMAHMQGKESLFLHH